MASGESAGCNETWNSLLPCQIPFPFCARPWLAFPPFRREYLSGAILFKETLAQHASDGTPFVDCLKARNVLAGIKVTHGVRAAQLQGVADFTADPSYSTRALQVDDGLEEIPGLAPETHTKGLEGLADRCSAYYSQGARFSKWRAAIRVGDSVPSMECAVMNAEELAEYAAVSQAAGLCPIVEPELLIEGSHSAQRFGDASQVRAGERAGVGADVGVGVWCCA